MILVKYSITSFSEVNSWFLSFLSISKNSVKVTLGILSSSLTTFITSDCNFSISSNPIWCTSSGVIPLVIVKVIYPKHYKHSNKSFTIAVLVGNFAKVFYFCMGYFCFIFRSKESKTSLKIFKHYKLKPSISIIKDNKAKDRPQVLTDQLILFDIIFILSSNWISNKVPSNQR